MPESVENTTPTTPVTDASSTGSENPSPEGLRFSTQAKGEPFEIAVLALQNLTIFPETVIPLAVGRPRSIAAVEAALATQEKLLGCITVRPDRADDTDATTGDLYDIGTMVMIKRMERVGDAMRIVVQGTERIKVGEWKQQDPYMKAVVQILPEPHTID